MWRSVKTLAQICNEYPWKSLCHLPASQSHPWRWSVPIWWICLFPETVLAAVGYLPEIKMQMVTENVFYNYLQKKKFRLVYFYIFLSVWNIIQWPVYEFLPLIFYPVIILDKTLFITKSILHLKVCKTITAPCSLLQFFK